MGGGLCLGGGSLSTRGISVRGDLCMEGVSVEREVPLPVRLCANGMHPTGMHSCNVACVTLFAFHFVVLL